MLITAIGRFYARCLIFLIQAYYQWVGFVLVAQAVLFQLPVFFWRMSYEMHGVPLQALASAASNDESLSASSRAQNIEMLSRFIDLTEKTGDTVSATRGNTLTILYLVTKVWFVLNAVGNLIFLRHFLGFDSVWWGFGLTVDVMFGQTWQQSGHFPRVTLCDFEVRMLGAVHRHTTQCTLMLNMFNEIAFLACWWLFLVSLLTLLLSLTQWVAVFVMSKATASSYGLVAGYICRSEPILNQNKRRRRRLVKRFVDESLRADGLLVLRLLRSNCGDACVQDVLLSLWRDFKAKNNINLDTSPDVTSDGVSISRRPEEEADPPKVKLAGSGSSQSGSTGRSPNEFPPTYQESLASDKG